jgi:hypothetical protein
VFIPPQGFGGPMMLETGELASVDESPTTPQVGLPSGAGTPSNPIPLPTVNVHATPQWLVPVGIGVLLLLVTSSRR